MNFDESLSEKWERAAGLRQQDFDDLQREVAGLEVGRIGRFLPDDVRNPEQSEKRKAEQQAEMLTRLQMMMRDPEYAALHEKAVKTLRQVSTELDQINEDARRLWEADTRAIAQIDERAARDSQGRAVFKDKGGETRYADGALVAEDEAAGIVWRGDEPSLEERQFYAERRARVEGIMADSDGAQAEIGDMQERLDDDDNPLSADEIKDLTEQAEGFAPALRSRLDSEKGRSFTPFEASQPSVSRVEIPKLPNP